MSTAGSSRVRFPNLSAEAFISETDQAAMRNLQRIPLLPWALRKFHEHAMDHVLYAYNSAESVRCSPTQFPTLYRILREGCEVLDLPEPELYVRYSPSYNAYTAGMERTFIVLHSSLVEGFTDDELRYVIGHELGHVKCSHVLYLMIGRMLLALLQAYGRVAPGMGPLAVMPLLSAFYEWTRQAEISCDRAGLLVCQDPRTAFSAIMKLGCGSSRFDHEMNVDAFLAQARDYSDAVGPDALGKMLLFVMYSWHLDHPQVIYRAKALDEWIHEGAYHRILRGNYVRVPQNPRTTVCPSCNCRVSVGVPYCPGCGTDLRKDAGGTTCGKCKEEVPRGIRFCPNCGAQADTTVEEEEPI
jgi:Zn-dependent protease with chaperone function